MDKKELISVIIPIYNVERYLRQCIDSILSQTYKNLEIILIDDGSTDGSSEICDSYAKKDKRIIVIHQKNHGISYVRNLGIQESTGDYIFWVDSDDYVSETIIEELLENLKETDADMSICEYIQGNDRCFSFDISKSDKIEVWDFQKSLEQIYENSHWAFVMAASWCKLIKKSLYKGLSYPNGKIFEDIYMSHKIISRCHKIVYSNHILYYYYQWPESILGKKLHVSKLDYLGAFEERIHFFEKKGLPQLVEKARVQYLHALTWEYSRAKDILCDQEIVKNIKKQYRKYYVFGIENKEFKHETKGYMLGFYVSPVTIDFLGKVRNKLLDIKKMNGGK